MNNYIGSEYFDQHLVPDSCERINLYFNEIEFFCVFGVGERITWVKLLTAFWPVDLDLRA